MEDKIIKENEKASKKDNSIVYIIIISILLIIIFSGIAWNAGKNYAKNEDSKNENRTEEKDTKKEEKPNDIEEPEESEDTVKTVYGTLKSDGVKDSVDITLNGKTNTLLLENNKKENGKILFGSTDIDFFIKYGTGPEGTVFDTIHEIDYRVVKGKDNKDYLVVSYGKGDSFQQVLLILNDNRDIIGKYSTHYENAEFFGKNDDCFALRNIDDEDDNEMYIVEEDNIEFYKYINGSLVNNNNTGRNTIKLELIKLEIDNNKVIEVKTGTVVSGEAGQCT